MRILNFFLKIFLLVLNSAPSLFCKDPMSMTSPTRSRKLPLHTCTVSVLSSSHRAYKRAQEFDGPSGSLFRKSARFTDSVEPYARDIKNWCLSILTLADDRILATECTIEKYFPASALVFDGTDNLIRAVEALPEKADQAVAVLAALIHKVPLLNWGLSCALSWLDSWSSEQDSKIAAREKDIPMDSRSAYSSAGTFLDSYSPGDDEEAGQQLFLQAEPLKTETKAADCCDAVSPRSTYKEVLLQKENREDHQGQKPSTEDAIDKEEVQEKDEAEKVVGEEIVEGLKDGDPILDLFESGWHMKPVKRATGSGTVRASWLAG